MQLLAKVLAEMTEYRTVEGCVRSRRLPAAAVGLSQIHKAHFIYTLCSRLNRGALVVMPNESEAQRLLDDLNSMFGDGGVYFYPFRDMTFRNVVGKSREYEHQRVSILSKAGSKEVKIVVCCIDAALQYTMPPAVLAKSRLKIKTGMQISMDKVIDTLLRCGFVRAEQVEGPGQFALRGGILDCFPVQYENPVRVEFWGDNIDSIAHFDVLSQRRIESAESFVISPATEVCAFSTGRLAEKIEQLCNSLGGKAAAAKESMRHDIEMLRQGVNLSNIDKYIPLIYDQPATLFDYFDDSILFVSEGHRVKERAASFAWQQGEDIKRLLEDGVLCQPLSRFSGDWDDALSLFTKMGAVYLDTLPRASYETPLKEVVNISARQLTAWNGSFSVLLEDIEPLLKNDYCCMVLSGTERTGRILVSDLQKAGLPAYFSDDPNEAVGGQIIVSSGTLSSGFEYAGLKFALITHSPVSKVKKTRQKRFKKGQGISNLSELVSGDYVVHVTHGIGIFEGIHKIEMSGITKDYIKIRYDKGDILYVPVTQLDLVSKYIGPQEDVRVKLNRLGGAEWKKTRTRVKRAVKDIAKQLMQLYAERLKIKGHSFSPDTEWQREFEERFQYKETDDQLRCTDEIKADMEKDVPMDRLLCGDVGFGKTEVALRAAFKCIMDGKQVAMLVPTTILAFQHFQTILSRMEGYPIRVEMLSRFRTAAEQKKIIRGIKKGDIDIIVGTHRLIQKDVEFKDLGLVIVDEEQRFGVAQKEWLKEKFKTVDVLTLSATPIPRTLNMAMSGIRDMSTIEEAPQDRHPVQTYVLEYDENIIADAIRRELHRGGQVYYLHNRVESIDNSAAKIARLVPEAHIGIAHGKMSEDELSDVWQRLLENEIDVLVCTTIIETGIDVQNVNTLIIENADKMGLAQLYQLRGRVGRSSRRAFAYLTFMKGKVLTEVSTNRLAAISEFTEFGSGIKIAMRDLEIRGAGNILGKEQHGHMMSVGYDMYLRLLNEAVSEEKGEKPAKREEECLVDLRLDAHIPNEYIPNLQQRLDIYRRIADIRSDEDANDVVDELRDRFGKPPEPVMGLIDIALIRNMAAQLGFYEISQKNGLLILYTNVLDMEFFSKAAAKLRGRIMLNAGNQPYIATKVNPGGSPVLQLKKLLDELNDL